MSMSVYSAATGFSSGTNHTRSSRVRRPGVGKARLTTSKQADDVDGTSIYGWLESIQAAAVDTNQTWEPNKGWVEYGDPKILGPQIELLYHQRDGPKISISGESSRHEDDRSQSTGGRRSSPSLNGSAGHREESEVPPVDRWVETMQVASTKVAKEGMRWGPERGWMSTSDSDWALDVISKKVNIAPSEIETTGKIKAAPTPAMRKVTEKTQQPPSSKGQKTLSKFIENAEKSDKNRLENPIELSENALASEDGDRVADTSSEVSSNSHVGKVVQMLVDHSNQKKNNDGVQEPDKEEKGNPSPFDEYKQFIYNKLELEEANPSQTKQVSTLDSFMAAKERKYPKLESSDASVGPSSVRESGRSYSDDEDSVDTGFFGGCDRPVFLLDQITACTGVPLRRERAPKSKSRDPQKIEKREYLNNVSDDLRARMQYLEGIAAKYSTPLPPKIVFSSSTSTASSFSTYEEEWQAFLERKNKAKEAAARATTKLASTAEGLIEKVGLLFEKSENAEPETANNESSQNEQYSGEEDQSSTEVEGEPDSDEDDASTGNNKKEATAGESKDLAGAKVEAVSMSMRLGEF